MSLLQTIRTIERTAAQQPAVNTIVRSDVFRLNAAADVRYGVFAWLQGEHTSAADVATVTYNFTFFYVDRLTADRRNEVEVQSVGMQTLENIQRALDGAGMWVQQYTFRTFNQRFADDCAGVFCNVGIAVPKDDLCEERYGAAGDYNDDYSDDYAVAAGSGDYNADYNGDYNGKRILII